MRWLIILAVVAIAVGVVSMSAPLYLTGTAPWVWGIVFWAAIATIIGSVVWGVWPRISPYAPIIQMSWPQGRKLWNQLIDRLFKRKIKWKLKFAAEKASPTWNKVEMGTLSIGQNEEETSTTVSVNGDPLDVDLRWWPQDKVFCQYTGRYRVWCERASDTALHEAIEIRYEIWIKQNGER